LKTTCQAIHPAFEWEKDTILMVPTRLYPAKDQMQAQSNLHETNVSIRNPYHPLQQETSLDIRT
jgi:hypothetical protein